MAAFAEVYADGIVYWLQIIIFCNVDCSAALQI